MKITANYHSSINFILCLLPGVAAAARPVMSKIPYFDNLYSQPAGTANQLPAARVPAHVPDPKSTQVQVFIFKKSTVIWNQPVPGLPALAPGTPHR